LVPGSASGCAPPRHRGRFASNTACALLPIHYCELIDASDRKAATKATYIQHADRFVCWLAGEINV
jgi:hypothetical protein